MSDHDHEHSSVPRSVPAGPSSCARAATTKEAAFRIDYPLSAARNTRVVAFDHEAERIIRSAALLDWGQARFFSVADPGGVLSEIGASDVSLEEVMTDTNTVIMVSTSGENGAAVAAVGSLARERGIMTAGLVVTPGALTSDALFHLRPHARILLVPAEEDDLIELLRATRA
ncbi:3-methyl-2-oxobutanoate hydroxymethyltransferase [Paenarthrobacter ureafaciens]|uniref:3-methyl-2-oxobutanoate hydroxymethyltransferase n=1 Tax=Paenarthrobacter ureafaciens TaxID=37931 RepID=A0AAX3EHV4_PAEUR|nr:MULTISPECIES: hypothetical protein [Paenarthrobacter]AMB42156.1 hypothetical protein AUT26_19500 [Arthrobacter sp. ATCC 21022]NKR11342.1 hypothetical protein [Arthrobacter sp. M5]NKR16652.1 hypothetical protein [Arthrobacter sp. M6]OEH57853.1 hypothetical protein A5N17_02080 [Arthrobacter sp. D2]OEH65091.1 hypothetical protein A5N13_10335 [Arthrobacter sp. D4]